MASEWKRWKIKELITAGLLDVGDGYRAKNDELGNTGLPFARAGNINGGFNFVDADRFPVVNLSKVGNKISRSADVVFTSKGTVGRFAFVEPHTEQFVYSPQLCYWRSLSHAAINPRYLYYWMQSPDCLDQFSYLKSQTDMADYVSLRDQREMDISLPVPSLQDSIVSVLSPLDLRLNILEQTNEFLESIARTIFKSWFVDFDPVRAKAEGREPEGMDADAAALFPSEFQESALGKIPKDWSIGTVRDLGSVICGKTPPTAVAAYYGDEIPFITIPDMSGRVFAHVTARKLSVQGADFQRNKYLPARSVCVSCIATVGLVCITSEPSQTNQQINSLVPNADFPCYFSFFTLQNMGDSIRSAGSGGSVFGNLNKGRFEALRLLLPKPSLARTYSSMVEPLFDKILSNVQEQTILSDLRDTLLPRLISGKLRVPEAEAMIAKGGE
jgi:type I restriction enzyme, S subunit